MNPIRRRRRANEMYGGNDGSGAGLGSPAGTSHERSPASEHGRSRGESHRTRTPEDDGVRSDTQ
jgi:hypothetical protein